MVFCFCCAAACRRAALKSHTRSVYRLSIRIDTHVRILHGQVQGHAVDILKRTMGIKARELAQRDPVLAHKAAFITLFACRPIGGLLSPAEHDMAARCWLPDRAPSNFLLNRWSSYCTRALDADFRQD